MPSSRHEIDLINFIKQSDKFQAFLVLVDPIQSSVGLDSMRCLAASDSTLQSEPD